MSQGNEGVLELGDRSFTLRSERTDERARIRVFGEMDLSVVDWVGGWTSTSWSFWTPAASACCLRSMTGRRAMAAGCASGVPGRLTCGA